MGCGCNGCLSRGIVDLVEDDSTVKVLEGYNKLPTTDWLAEYNDKNGDNEFVEVRFKNTRKEYFKNSNNLSLTKGDVVAVESQLGHDIGTVSLTGRLVRFQIKRKGIDTEKYEFRTVYRKARQNDLRKWRNALDREHSTMLKTRKIVEELGLEMKVSDVEYQGDGSKAIFYYIADDRVDFRELIKVLAKEFHIRVEMKQIGVRQEAGRIGGIGSCGRELCCSSWKTDFHSVTLNAAKVQELPANVQKLAGQCGKLKCCLMYELDTYMEAREDIPGVLLELETERGIAYHHKTDILKRIMYYSFDENSPENLIPVPVDRVKEIITMNKKGIKAEQLVEEIYTPVKHSEVNLDFVHSNASEDINRFNNKTKKNNNRRRRKKGKSK